MIENQISGDRIREIEMFERVKIILIDFLRGYPAHKYYGIFEYYFEQKIATEIINQLKEDKIIKLYELNINGTPTLAYSLTGEGAQLATSLSTHRNIVRLTKNTHSSIVRLTKILGIIAGMSVIAGLIAVLPQIFFAFN